MKMMPVIFAAILLCATGAAHAINGSLSGGSGLVVMRTAQTLPRGALDLSAFGWGDSFLRPDSSHRSTDISMMPGLNYGVVNNLEVGFNAPYRYHVETSDAGVQLVRGYAKYRFLHLPGDGIDIAVTAFGSLYTSGKADIASGDGSYGGEINISLPRLLEPALDFHVTLGYEKSDIVQLADTVRYRQRNKRFLDIGVETPPFGAITGSLEVLYTRWSPAVNNFLIVPGIRYAANRRLNLIMGFGWGAPRHQAQPQYRLIGGLSYVFDGPSPPAASPSAPR